MTPTTIAIGILALAGVAVVVFLIRSSTRQRRSIEDVPPGRRPGYSDEELETTVLERYMAWGVVLTLFFAIFLPIYWWNETRRLPAEEQTFFVESVVHGEEEYQQLCAQCHGPDAGGGAAAAPDGEGQWPVPALNNIVARYEDNPNITDVENFMTSTIERGRPGTPMPTFGQAYGGPLTDQTIQDIVNWILANQVDPEAPDEGGDAEEAPEADDPEAEDPEAEDPEAEDDVAGAVPADASGQELFVGNCAKCHGEDLQGGVAPSLIGVFERHTEDQVRDIVRNGIIVPTGAIMPPWQNGYMYPDSRLDDEAIDSIVEYLAEQQPEDPDEVETEEEGLTAPDPPAGDEPGPDAETDPEDTEA